MKIIFKIISVVGTLLFTVVQLAADNGTPNGFQESYKFKHLDINDGLSNNQISSIIRDSRGFLWFGTDRGLNRFDGTNFKVYFNDLSDTSSIPFNRIDFLYEDIDQNIWIRSGEDFGIFNPFTESFKRVGTRYKQTAIPLTSLQTIFKDSKQNMWFIASNYGLYKYSSVDQSVDSVKYVPDYEGLNQNNYLNDIAEDSKGNYWVVSNSGVVLKLAGDNYRILEEFQLDEAVKTETNNFSLFIDGEDIVWIFYPGGSYGVFLIDPETGSISNYNENSYPIQLNNNLVSSVIQDQNGLIWVATDHGGINIIDKEKEEVSYLINNRDNPYSISQNSVTCLYKDYENIIWSGTYKNGINYYHPNLIRFKHYNNIPSDPGSLPFNDVNCFAEDKSGNLWIGTNGGGLIYFDRENNTFKSYLHDPKNPKSLSNNIIVSLLIDRHDVLWIGTYFGGLNLFDGNRFKRFQHDPNDKTSLPDDRVWEIYEDSEDNIWIGTLNGGLALYNPQKESFLNYKSQDINSIGGNFVISIIEDSEHNLWLGTSDGLDRLNLNTERFYLYYPDPGVPGKLSDRNIIDLLEDERGFIWIGTRQGLNVFDKNSQQFKVFTEKDGLANSSIKTIREDQQGNLWISTNNGLSRIITNFNPDSTGLRGLTINVDNFNPADGLQGREFNEKSAYRTRSGELIFGGANGFNIFIPEEIKSQTTDNEIVLTNFKVFNQEIVVDVPFRNHIILDKSITYKKEITLRHNVDLFSIGFAALNFFQPDKNIFEYRLNGFNDDWLQVDKRLNEISFTNLSAGTYQLQIRVSVDGDNWTEMDPPLVIDVLPSFWQSPPAYIIYFILFGLALWISRSMMLERQRLKYEAEQEHLEAERIQQLDTLKTKFFTNISHEFRTPLSLIISPLDKLIAQTTDKDIKNHLVLIQRNAQRLLAMVNQLLDFRKMEVQKLQAKNTWGEMVSFIRDICSSFEDLVENKQINFSYNSSVDQVYTYFDKDKTDKIIANLLSNAFKFTPNKGNVSLKIELVECDTYNNTAVVRWIVKDSGIGIAPELQDKIFDRFYQSEIPSSIVNQGNGIGLSMVNEYVTILGGKVVVESILGKGSIFTVEIPISVFSEKEIAQRNSQQQQEIPRKRHIIETDKTKKPAIHDTEKKTILLVEDNADFRFYLKDNLLKYYNILEAEDGSEGWEIVQQYTPHLVVSDIMMPNTDGLTLCSMIKTNRKTKHIPVILLTAKTDNEPIIEGFESGADDYISKPFDFKILESRIENLINTREQLRRTYQSMIGVAPEKIEVSSQDEKFIKKALETVEAYLAESSFSVEDFGVEMGMSRVSLYKKMVALTNKTPTEFIRIIRLKRAADLLTSSQLSVSEIAYKVGFNNPRYFSKYFSEQFGMLPSAYIAKHRNPNVQIPEEMKKKYS